MSVKKMGSKLAQGVRQVKSQQGKPGQPEAEKPQVLPAAAPAAAAKKSSTVAKPAAPRPVQKAAQSGSEQAPKHDENLHPSRVWPD
ncbi:MAG: hypothetical protein ACYDDT_13340 [Sulfuricella sp.]